MNSNAGLYIRLSVMDDYQKKIFESESVENQRIILTDYAKEHNFKVVKEYVDDGYSGTNFDRPGFQEMMEDLKNKVIDTIIVKDLSRFGRDHIQTGYFIETFFPLNNIRFISLMEELDSQKQNIYDYNNNVTFVMACNDYYSKQYSVKVRMALDCKKRAGKFVGSNAPFGYMKDPKDKNHLIPNPEVEHIVRFIFKLAEKGKYAGEIADKLNEYNYITPSKYMNLKKYIDKWNSGAVNKIISNRMYAGDMVQSKGEKASYKSDKKICNPKSKWIIVNNTHEPLVDKRTFFAVQSDLKRSDKTICGRERELLENLIYCKECGNAITLAKNKRTNKLYGDCTTHSSFIKGRTCTSHYIIYDTFEKIVMDGLSNIDKINIGNVDRHKIQKIIDRIFLDNEKNITVVFKKKIKPLELKYLVNYKV